MFGLFKNCNKLEDENKKLKHEIEFLKSLESATIGNGSETMQDDELNAFFGNDSSLTSDSDVGLSCSSGCSSSGCSSSCGGVCGS